MALNPPSSLLEVFIDVARNPDTAGRRVLECGPHAWTYAQLDTVSNAMADELLRSLGCFPRLASVCENHPYIFALMLAVWKLGGIFIPIDAHAPSVLLASMLKLVKPTCLVLSTTDISNIAGAAALDLCILSFDPKHSTIPALNLKYGTNDVDIGTATFMNAGCYVFASIPITYPSVTESTAPVDLTSLVITGILDKNVSAFACVPFVLSGLKAACESAFPANGELLNSLRDMIMLECGGAMLDRDVCDWAAQNGVPVVVGIGMTETGGAIFAGPAGEAFSGFAHESLISDAELSLIGDEAEGELVVKSRLIPHGYIRHDDGSFSVDEDGWVTFRTGDRYSRTHDGKFLWLGRTTDFIQMTSGETLDPRPIQNALCASRFIRNACVIGDMFLNGASTAVYAIVELETANDTETPLLDVHAAKLEVARVLAPINRDLLPALRIAWSSVLILHHGQTIPLTRKREVFRKKIESACGAAIAAMHSAAVHTDEPHGQVGAAIAHIVRKALGVLDADMLNSMSFAELGMTSLLAVKIADTLNKHLNGRVVLPPNICYIHLNLPSLINTVQGLLAASSHPPPPVVNRSRTCHPTDDVVIVGKAFRLPGAIDNHKVFRDVLLLGKRDSVITDIPPDRWDHPSFFPRDICFEKAGLLNVASYDYSFFGLTATEALYVSPTMRLALEVAFEALENANIPISKLKGSNMGVYVATKDDGFETLLHAAHGYEAYTRFYGTGRAPSTASGRISYLLDVHGPSLTVDTACSGGIVCIDQAVNYLQSGAGESAIVCSSNTHCWPGSFMFLTAQGMTSPNSRCATFTSEADGYVPSEGAVAFILKTRRAAIRDEDCILAIINGTEVAHNGQSQGLAAPNMKSQAALHRALLHKIQLDPSHIDFIETHGTGTALGDLCEIQGINEVFSSAQLPRAHPLILGASKSALGHTECSAGLVGILSVLLSFQEKFVPGLLHLREDNVNPTLDCTAVPLVISGKPVPLQADKPQRALVMSYGFSGTLAEIALESPEQPLVPEDPVHTGPMLFVVSAKTAAALRAYLDTYLSFLKCADSRSFHRICYTACVGREHYKHRFACVATDLSDLIRQLERDVSAPSHLGRASGSVAFSFPGQGSLFPGMAAFLAAKYSRFRELIVESGRRAHALCGVPVEAILLDGAIENHDHGRSETDQICIFIYQYSACRWLKELGIEARAVIGHSLGEITAAVIAGGLTFDVALDLVITRARLLRPPCESPGGMVAMASTEAKVSEILALEKAHFTSLLTVSVINSPQSVAISGMSEDIDKLVLTAKRHNIKATRLHVDQGFHSPCVDRAIPGLYKWSVDHSALFTPLQMTLYSTLLGEPVLTGKILHSNHWVDHARQPVLFSRAAAAIQEDISIGAILDIGPQTIGWSLLLANGHTPSSTLALSAKKGDNQEIALLTALAALFQNHRITPNFSALYAQRGVFETTVIPTAGATKSVPHVEQNVAVNPEVIKGPRRRMSAEEFRASVIMCVRDVLEIGPGEELDDSESLSVRGVDSIMFAQLRKRVEELYGLNLSVVFWSDAFSIADMVHGLLEQYVEQIAV
ncbi:hypothetical protein DFH09DRAFT_1468227 [Mycena vulgaris]|nr:hypothetical protein DFH09DRAFT_1468227 [Mycena vulgaris]